LKVAVPAGPRRYLTRVAAVIVGLAAAAGCAPGERGTTANDCSTAALQINSSDGERVTADGFDLVDAIAEAIPASCLDEAGILDGR
jgi:hypothetical protein